MPMLTVHDTATIRRIEDAIGYTFNDKRLLVQVLTRKTYLKIDPEAPDNEVLEFYGDTLMNYHVTNYFMSKYAHMLEDGLFFMRTVEQFTDMRSHYVCNRYLTERIKAMGLARYLRAQNRDAELRRDGEKVYADIFESLVGAIYLDSYQNEALIRAFILRQLGIEPKSLPDEIEDFDYDTLLIPTTEDAPVESVESAAEKATEPVDTVPEVLSVILPDPAVPLADDSTAPTEESHEESAPVPAAESAPVTPEAAPTLAENVDAPSQELGGAMQDALAAFCLSMGYDLPIYGETPKNAPHARPVAACTLRYTDRRGKLVKISLNDSGKSLAEATEKAAAKMLGKLEKQAAEGRIRPMVRTARTEEAASAVDTVAPVEAEGTPVVDTVESAPMESAEAPIVTAVTEVMEATPVTEIAEEAEALEAVEMAEAVEAVEIEEAVEIKEPAEAVEMIDAAEPVEIAEQLVMEMPAEAAVTEAPQATEVAEAVVVVEEAPSPKKNRAKSTTTRDRKTTKATAAEAMIDGEAPVPAKKPAPRRTRAKAATPAKKSAETVVEMIMEPVMEEKVETVEAVAETMVEPVIEPVAATAKATEATAETSKPRTRRTTKKAAEASTANAPKTRARTSRSKKNEG